MAKTHAWVSGFCQVGRHERCPGRIENGANVAAVKGWYAYCSCDPCDHHPKENAVATHVV